MTEIEVKCIELIIDKYTREVDNGPYGGCSKKITEIGIEKIKEDIRKLANKEQK